MVRSGVLCRQKRIEGDCVAKVGQEELLERDRPVAGAEEGRAKAEGGLLRLPGASWSVGLSFEPMCVRRSTTCARIDLWGTARKQIHRANRGLGLGCSSKGPSQATQLLHRKARSKTGYAQCSSLRLHSPLVIFYCRDIASWEDLCSELKADVRVGRAGGCVFGVL